MEFIIGCPNNDCIMGKVITGREMPTPEREVVHWGICPTCGGVGKILVKYLRPAEINDKKFGEP